MFRRLGHPGPVHAAHYRALQLVTCDGLVAYRIDRLGVSGIDRMYDGWVAGGVVLADGDRRPQEPIHGVEVVDDQLEFLVAVRHRRSDTRLTTPVFSSVKPSFGSDSIERGSETVDRLGDRSVSVVSDVCSHPGRNSSRCRRGRPARLRHRPVAGGPMQ